MASLFKSLRTIAQFLGNSSSIQKALPGNHGVGELVKMAGQASIALDAVGKLQQARQQLEQTHGRDIQALRQLHSKVTTMDLDKMITFALQDGLRHLTQHTTGSNVDPGLLEGDPFGVLLGLSSKHPSRPVTWPDYLQLCHEVGSCPAAQPKGIASVSAYCTALETLLASLEESANSATVSDRAAAGASSTSNGPSSSSSTRAEVDVASLSFGAFGSSSSTAGTRGSSKGHKLLQAEGTRLRSELEPLQQFLAMLAQWRSAHGFMLRRDLSRLDPNYLELRLKIKMGADAFKGSKEEQMLTDLKADFSKLQQMEDHTLDKELWQRFEGTLVPLLQQVHPHKGPKTEVGLLLQQYEEEMHDRLAQLQR